VRENYYGVSVELIDEIRRSTRMNGIQMRKVCVAMHKLGVSTMEIGALLNRDHSTIVYHLQTHAAICLQTQLINEGSALDRS
jgi:chromosomal replication initiation ATPase DnaA